MTKAEILGVVIPWWKEPSPRGLAAGIVKIGKDAGAELVVVDDASPWPTPNEACEVIEEHGAQYFRITHNEGPGAARNVGLDLTNLEFVNFSDADDVPNFEELVRMARLGHESQVDVVIGGYRRVLLNGTTKTYYPGQTFLSAVSDQPAVWRYVFRREFLIRNHIRFPTGTYGEDLVFLLRVMACQPKVLTIQNICYDYVDTQSRDRLSGLLLSTSQFMAVLNLMDYIETDGENMAFCKARNFWKVRIWFRWIRSSTSLRAATQALSGRPHGRRLFRDSSILILRLALDRTVRRG